MPNSSAMGSARRKLMSVRRLAAEIVLLLRKDTVLLLDDHSLLGLDIGQELADFPLRACRPIHEVID